MKLNDRRIRSRAGLAVEDLVALDIGMLVRRHLFPLVVNRLCLRGSTAAQSSAPAASSTKSTTVAGSEV